MTNTQKMSIIHLSVGMATAKTTQHNTVAEISNLLTHISNIVCFTKIISNKMRVVFCSSSIYMIKEHAESAIFAFDEKSCL